MANLARSGRPTKLSEEAKVFIDQQMRSNDEMTSAQIRKNKKLAKCGVRVSSSTVRRSRKKQGWTLQRTAMQSQHWQKCQHLRRNEKQNSQD